MLFENLTDTINVQQDRIHYTVKYSFLEFSTHEITVEKTFVCSCRTVCSQREAQGYWLLIHDRASSKYKVTVMSIQIPK